MVKKDKRNIGKLVKYILPDSAYFGRTAKILGFRGNHGCKKGCPYVVLSDGNSTSGCSIEIIKKETL